MALDFYVDIEDGAGNLQGAGPIRSVTAWKSTIRLDRDGDFTFSMAAADPQRDIIQHKRIASAYALLNGHWTYIGGGVIERIITKPGDDGLIMLEVSGSGMLRELSSRTVGELSLASSGTAITVASALASVMAIVPTWSYSNLLSGSIYAQFFGESALTALTKIAARLNGHFCLTGKRSLKFFSAPNPAAIWAVEPAFGALTAQPEQCFIRSIVISGESSDLVTRIYPWGAGQGQARLSLAPISASIPSGYTGSAGQNWLQHNSGYSAYGQIERHVQFKDIAPVSNTSADLASAANTLLDAAQYYLEQHSAPITSYSLAVSQCSTLLRPTDTIHVLYRHPEANIDIDDDLYILASTIAYDGDTVQTVGLEVSTALLSGQSDANVVASVIEQGNVFQAHPQLNANSYVTAYTKNVDGAALPAQDAFFRFRLGAEVTQLTQALFEFQILPLESTVKNVGASSTTTSSGGGTTATSSSGGGSTITSSSGGGTTLTSSSGGSSTPTSSSGGGTTATSTSGGGSTPTSSSGGGSTQTSTYQNPNSYHAHDVPIAAIGGGPFGSPVYISATFGLNAAISGSGTADPISLSLNHAHDVTIPAHTHTVTISAHTHDVTIPSHTHTVTIPSHTHDVTIPSHTHTVTVASHTHDVTIPSHTHTVTAAITTTYGIYRESAGNTLALADLEFRVNGGSWISASSEASDAGDGWYSIDVTSLIQNATTLRPLYENNLIEMRGIVAKTATIDAQLSIRNIIQAIAYT